ncbi:MAG TPA: methyltransferase domain-containing protein [Phycisphaerae bacterium]|nr:methyltransferase domain-containing protein [Phycisphaerae bacterium]
MSATVPTGKQSESDVLDVRAEVWQKRPLLREIYNRYFAEMVSLFAAPGNGFGRCGLILELGGGSGNFKEYFAKRHGKEGRLVASDIVPTRHCDLAADATALPFAEESLDNIVMQDVLHHIPYPLRFLGEAERTLRRGGRVVMTEPYISPASRVVFKVAHPEPVVPSAEIFGREGAEDPSPLRGSGAFASNQATPTRLFFRDLGRLEERFPRLKVVARRRRSVIVYPLSGGFSGPQLLPRALQPVAWGLEKALMPLSGLLAFRLVAALEKT